MQSSETYLRIGTAYYKVVRKPLVSGDKIELLIPWSVECIKQDHGKDFLSTVQRYDGFCLVPGHLDYQRRIDNFYNRYNPFVHEPRQGYPKQILVFLNHVFGEQLELGLDYFKILLLYPTQILPILCLVSKERNTGKTTFLNFLKAVFGDNMTINSNEDFRSNFNAEWASKLIIGVDETFLDKKEDSERIKNLSTSRYYKIEAKGQDRQEIEFFGKFVLCSNNEDNFIQIDASEIRYWIRRLPSLQSDNRNLLAELKQEIPFFIRHLIERPFATQPATRMWFRPEQIATAALKHIKRFNRNRLESEMAQILLHILDTKETIPEICFCLSDMQDWLQKKDLYKGILMPSGKYCKASGNCNLRAIPTVTCNIVWERTAIFTNSCRKEGSTRFQKVKLLSSIILMILMTVIQLKENEWVTVIKMVIRFSSEK